MPDAQRRRSNRSSARSSADPVRPHRYNTRLSATFRPNGYHDRSDFLTGPDNLAEDRDMSLRRGFRATHLNPCSEPNFIGGFGRFAKYALILILIGVLGMAGQMSLQKYLKRADLDVDLGDVKSIMKEMRTNMESIMKARDETNRVIEDIHKLFHNLRNRDAEKQCKLPEKLTREVASVPTAGGVEGGSCSPGTIQSAIDKYDADKIGMIDYALETLGAEILATPNTNNYNAGDSISLFGWKLCSNSRGPSSILQASVSPGQCWAFCGTRGSVVVKLVREIVVTAVSVEHIPKQIAPSNDISSAPKNIILYGIRDYEEIQLGNFTYDANAYPPIQTFETSEKCQTAFSRIRIDFLSNHGNPRYTCVYRIRVHGEKSAKSN